MRFRAFVALLCLVSLCLVNRATAATSGLLNIPQLDEAPVNTTAGLVKRGIDLVTNQPTRSTWPNGRILYCYANAATRTSLQPYTDPAIQAWINALGGPASAQTRHSLSFTETKVGNNIAYCYGSDYRDFNRPGTWNAYLDRKTLAIHLTTEGVATTSVGYETRGNLPPGHVHVLRVAGAPSLYTMIHELGHAIGFAHEHQRLDRDNYINYRCENVKSYSEAYRRAHDRWGREQSPQQITEYLCGHRQFAMEFGFTGGINYLKIEPSLAHSTLLTAYDVQSVMHYPSTHFNRNLYCGPQATQNCPLSTKQNAFIPTAAGPSALDAQAVRMLYPWRG